MKLFLAAIPFFAFTAVSLQTSAACMKITNNYSGSMAPNSQAIVYGPFTITHANGCSNANIAASVSATGVGSAPKIYIDSQQGSTWQQVAGDTGNNVSYLGPIGTYRIRQTNTETVSKSYSGSTGYGR